MKELLKPFESKVKSEADAGHFPWDKEAVSTSASFAYTVTFPQGAQVGAAAAVESSSMIASVTETAVSPDGLTHTFKIKLNDVNWVQIYQGHQADLVDPAAHTVDITIPYTAVVNAKDGRRPSKALRLLRRAASASIPPGPGAVWESASRPSRWIRPARPWRRASLPRRVSQPSRRRLIRSILLPRLSRSFSNRRGFCLGIFWVLWILVLWILSMMPWRWLRVGLRFWL